jgi:T5SS/PEP-CTERM-associated repeat protein
LIIGDEGDDEVFHGEINVLGNFPGPVNGSFTRFTLSGPGTSTNPTVQVGREGTGVLNLSGGAAMNLSNPNSNFSVGVLPGGVGSVSVSDRFSMLTLENDLHVGQGGIGQLEILDGAVVETISNNVSRAVRVGTDATGVGMLRLDGPGSVLRAGSNLVVGGAGQGTLILGDQAIVDADNGSTATISVGPRGRIEMGGGTLIGNKPAVGFGATVNGYLGGAGLVRASVDFTAASRLEVGPGDALRFDGKVSNQGAVTVENGELRFLADFTNNVLGAFAAPGRITLEDGTIRFAQPLTNDGVISAARGANNIHGQIVNQGTIVVASDTVATFNDMVTDNGGTITVLPRGNALFLGDVMFQAASAVQLAVGLDGTTDNSAQVGVAGALTLGGDLTVAVDSGYVPAFGDRFELFTAGGGLVGTFNSAMLPDIPGNLEFGLLYGPTSVIMEARIEQNTIGLPGDYNRNGIVDAADYIVWRDRRGSNSSLPNDDTPGVGADDYDRWRANFGLAGEIIVGTASAVHPAVPEPSSFVFALVAILACSLTWRPA